MRISRFRGKRLDNGEWVYGYLCENMNGDLSIQQIVRKVENGFAVPHRIFKVKPESVGQFTGLHDKNGKEIYEGDVLRMYDNNNYTFTCIYLQTQSAFLGKCNETQLGLANITEGVSKEIIGNIHDNHELLKTE